MTASLLCSSGRRGDSAGTTVNNPRHLPNQSPPEGERLIWRRVQVASETMLAQLRRVLQCMMGWEGSHLSQCVVASLEYSAPRVLEEMEGEDARRVTLVPLVRDETCNSSLRTILGIAGNANSSSRRYCRRKTGSATYAASPANGPTLPKIAVASGDTGVFCK